MFVKFVILLLLGLRGIAGLKLLIENTIKKLTSIVF